MPTAYADDHACPRVENVFSGHTIVRRGRRPVCPVRGGDVSVGQREAVDGRPTRATHVSRIYAEHGPALRRRCLGLTGDATTADDLAQETLTRFIARLSALPDDLDARAYLLATARNLWMNQLRRRGDIAAIEIDDVEAPDERIETDPLRVLLLAEQRADVQHGTASLTERQRRALTLRELGDQSYAEIGSELGLQANAVAQVVWRARTQLRRSLRRSQIDESVLKPACRARIDTISDLVDETSSRDTVALKMHLTDCRDCRRTFAAFQEAGSRLRGALPLVPLAAIATRVGSALRAGDAVTSSLGTVAAVTAAVVVTAGGGGALMQHYGALPAWNASMHHAPTRLSAGVAAAGRGRPTVHVEQRKTVRHQFTTVANGPTSDPPQLLVARVDRASALKPMRSVRQRIAPITRHRPIGAPTPDPVVPAVDPPSTAKPQEPVTPPQRVKSGPGAPPSDGDTPPAESTKTPPGQEKKTKDAVAPPTAPTPGTAAKKMPPGQAKKDTSATSTPTATTADDGAKAAPGQVKKAANATAPPAQTVPAGASKSPPGQAKAASKTPPVQSRASSPGDPAETTPSASPAKPTVPGKDRHDAAHTTTPAPVAPVTPVAAAPTTPPPSDGTTAPVVPVAVPSTPAADQPPATGTLPDAPPPRSGSLPSDSPSPNAPTGSPPGNGKGHGPK
jgi:RNA polymerase sigma factor (sigma-70 family)